MTGIISVMVFLLGMLLAVQVVASLHGPLDYGYTIKTKISAVILRIMIWGGLSVILIIVLGGQYRWTFLWGLMVYAVFYLFTYPLTKLILKMNLKRLERECEDQN